MALSNIYNQGGKFITHWKTKEHTWMDGLQRDRETDTERQQTNRETNEQTERQTNRQQAGMQTQSLI